MTDTTCPDCSRPVETSQLHDPADGEPVTIWDCAWCERSGFLSPPAPTYVWPNPVPARRVHASSHGQHFVPARFLHPPRRG